MERAQPPAAPAQAVLVRSSTWDRDSHGLFDFESRHLHTKTFRVPKSMVCVRNDTNVDMSSECGSPLGSDPLFQLVQKDGAFWVEKAPPQSSSKNLWLVVRDTPSCGHVLSENDVIKLGRCKFRVRQLVASAGHGDVQPELRLDDSSEVLVPDASQGNLSSTQCRVCLLDGPGENDPLIAPCACKGSIEYVHLSCLRLWIRGRMNLLDTSVSVGSYVYRALPCELCKAIYPTYVTVESEQMLLVDVPRTKPPFIVLENMAMVRDSPQRTSRSLHVISLAEKVLKLGRGHESGVRIAADSISRCHAMIRFDRGHFILEDNNSRFGTLVAMKRPRLLKSGSTVSIQMGRTVLSLLVQPDPSATNLQPLFLLEGSNAHDERALRLSLLNRGSSRVEPADAAGAAGQPEEPGREAGG